MSDTDFQARTEAKIEADYIRHREHIVQMAMVESGVAAHPDPEVREMWRDRFRKIAEQDIIGQPAATLEELFG